MKYLELILVILAAVCIYQIEAIPKPSEALNYLEETVNGTLEFVINYKHHLAFDGAQQFRELYEQEEAAIATDFENGDQVIEEMIQEADIEDSLAAECQGWAESLLILKVSGILDVLYRCVEDNQPHLSNFNEQIEVNIQNGKQLLDKFTGIRENCVSELVNDESCIARPLLEATGLVAVYEANVAKLKAEVALKIAKGFNDIAVCSESPLATFRNEVQNIVSSAKECIKSV